MTIQKDKVMHCVACVLIVVLVTKANTLVCHGPAWASVWLGAMVALATACAKEVHDMVSGGVFDLMDIVADVCGVAVGVLLADRKSVV